MNVAATRLSTHLPSHYGSASTIVISYYVYFAAILFTLTGGVMTFSPLKANVDTIDAVGETIAFIASTCWIYLILVYRPLGRVTYWLGVGAGCMATGFYLDLLDEFFSFTELFGGSFENVAVPLGAVMLTWALYLLHQEQSVFSAQRSRREAQLRDHTIIDKTTALYGIRYLIEEMELRDGTSCALVMVEVTCPEIEAYFSLQRFLRKRAAEHLETLAPEGALVAHYAGNRFCILLDQPASSAEQFAALLPQSLKLTLEGSLFLQSRIEAAIGCRALAVACHRDHTAQCQVRALSEMLSNLQDV